ncbi:hypothetical protein BDQ17DRAFT_139486 [Cyathus striatus]|nr:hypothetical protein BDQ17DRAFT_139486 [Cyathus striatus]
MSSRAAAGRKRLQDPSASTKKGLFSRSKSVAPPPSKDAQASYPSPSGRKAPLPQQGSGFNSAPPGSTAFTQSANYPPENRHFSNGAVPHPQYSRDANAYYDPQYDRMKTTTLPSPSPYQSAREEQYRPGPGLRKPPADLSHLPPRHPGSASGRDMHSASPQQSYQPPASFEEQHSLSQLYSAAEGTFFEASYQPPPPPPIRAIRPQSPRTLPSYPATPNPLSRPSTADNVKPPLGHPGTVASPVPRSPNPARPIRPATRPLPIYSASSDPDFHFPPSSTNSPPNNSLLLQPAQQFPQHSELPAYASFPGSFSDARPSLHVSTDREYQAQAELAYDQHRSPYDYPSPPTSNPRYTPSPLRHHDSPIISSLSLSPEISVIPRQLNVQPFPRSRSNPAASIISTSSGSSRHSNESAVSKPASSDGPKPFVFPGGRSNGRPKVSAKTGTPQIKLRGKRSKSKPARTVNPNESMLSPSSASGSNSGSQYSPSIDARSPVSPNASDIATSPLSAGNSMSSMGLSIQQQERARTMSSPSAVQTEPAKPEFFYPSGRTRAHPKTPPKPKVRTRKKSAESGNSGKSTKFLGITIKKKKKYPPLPTEHDSPLAHTLSTPSGISDELNAGRRSNRSDSTGGQTYNSSVQNGPSSQQSQGVNESFRDNQPLPEPPQQESRRMIKTKVGSYPLDPYDTTLLDNDRQTGELLRRINPKNSPTYHDYGNFPPSRVLDLGCGQGHWVLDAAITWKGYGTRVTGMDMVDIAKTLRPWAVKHGVADNIRFIRGNFVKQRLPFPSEAFDLVRMSCLALCIATERWEFVLQEVQRVLSPGGRLEFIDDHVFFPYGKAPLGGNGSPTSSLPRMELPTPQLDIHIPNSSFSTFSICDPGHLNPGLGAYHDDDERSDEDLYDLYGVQEEEDDDDDAATVSGHNSLASYDTFGNRGPALGAGSHGFEHHSNGMNAASWNQQADTCRELESLFEDMMYHKYGIHVHPSEFILELLKHVFGFSRHMKTMHLTLAPPDASPPASVAPSADGMKLHTDIM